MTTKRRASGSEGRPFTTASSLARYSHLTARTEPSWIITVKTPPGSSNRSSRAPINRCAVDDTGRNSVRPWRIPSSAAGITLIIAPPGRGALRRAGALARFLRGSRRRGGDRSGRGLLLAAQHDRDRGGD